MKDAYLKYILTDRLCFIPKQPALLVVNKDRHLIISDLHLRLPRLRDISIAREILTSEILRIISLVRKYKIDIVVINGDLKEEIRKPSKLFSKHLNDSFQLLAENVKKIVICKGNHDGLLENILQIENVSICDSYKCADVLISHGHKRISIEKLKNVNIVITAHLHPVALITHQNFIIKMKCWVISLIRLIQQEQRTLLWIIEPAFSKTWGFPISHVKKEYLEKNAPIQGIKIEKTFLLSLDLLFLKSLE